VLNICKQTTENTKYKVSTTQGAIQK